MSLYSKVPSSSPEAEEFLHTLPLFADLNQDQLKHVAMRIQRREFAPGVTLFHQDMPGTMMYMIETGSVRVISIGRTGQELTLNVIGPGEIFGEYAAIDGEPRSASVEARSSCLIASMSAKEFRKLLETEPAMAQAVMRALVRNVRSLTKRVYEFSTLAVNNRIHAEILRLANLASREGEVTRIVPAPTHLEIASRVSAHRGDRASVKSCGEDPSAGFNIPPLADRNTPTSSKRRFSRGRHPF